MLLAQVDGLIEGYQYSFRVKAVNLGSTVNFFIRLLVFFAGIVEKSFVNLFSAGFVELLSPLRTIRNYDCKNQICQSHVQAARNVRH